MNSKSSRAAISLPIINPDKFDVVATLRSWSGIGQHFHQYGSQIGADVEEILSLERCCVSVQDSKMVAVVAPTAALTKLAHVDLTLADLAPMNLPLWLASFPGRVVVTE